MMRITKVLFISILLISLFSFGVMAGSLPDTGQTKCYNTLGEIPCPQPGEPFYGQDANFTINPPFYTKLGAQSNDLPDSATAWVMVRDNVTGLIWEVKTDDGSIHDQDNTYLWCDTNPDTNGGDVGSCGNRTHTENFINALKDENFGGFSDWRLPTIEELRFIANYGRHSPAIDTAFFPNTVFRWEYYWTSTTLASHTNSAWGMQFGIGNEVNADKYESFHVRAVRGGVAVSRFKDNGDGTVTDTDTGLMWQQATATNSMNWQNALSYCANLTLGGYDDWRLPNINELSSLADRNRYNPAIDTDYFPDTVLYGNYYDYWSSTTYVGSAQVAWAHLFSNGRGFVGNSKSHSYYVRAVRPAQSYSDACVADFSASPTKGVAPLIVNFTDQSTGTVDSWNWSFGDASTSTKQNPSHTYTDPGTYTVSLTVTGPGGSDTNTKADYIKVAYSIKAMPWIPLLLLDD